MAGRDVLGGLQDDLGDGVDLGGAQFTNLGPSVEADNAARVDYVDNAVDGASDAVEALEANAPLVVNATLGGAGFDIVLDHASVTTGPVVFKMQNVALGIHELLLVKTATSAADIIASVGPGGTWDETDQDIRFDTDTIPAGHYVRADLTLEAGHYVALCNEAGHTHLGMAIDFNVTYKTGTTANDIAGR